MHHHHHLLLFAKIAITVGAVLAASTAARHDGNGLTQPTLRLQAHPVILAGAR